MIRRIVFFALVLTAVVFPGARLWAQQAFQVFFLAAGSSYYFPPAKAGEHGFENLTGANSSARRVSQILLQHGAMSGVTLVSAQGHYLTKGDFYAALKAVAGQIRTRRPTKPLLVVYFAGHGVSEGVAWNHFSVPGDFIYGSPMERLNIEEFAKHTIYASELVDTLESMKIPFVLLLDTCYDGKARSFESPVLTSQASQSLASVAAILRFQNEFHTPNPVIFSAEPGTRVPLAPDPASPETDSLGPIARRLYLVDQEMRKSNNRLSVADFVSRITSPQLDAQTRPPVTHVSGPDSKDIFLGQATVNAMQDLDIRQATGATGTICCTPSASVATEASGRPDRRISGSLKFEGPAGEFISGGHKVDMSNSKTWIKVSEPDMQSIEITFDGNDGWELDIAAPTHEKLATKTYQRAQRYPFQDDGRPGLSLSGSGRACNEVEGKFTVDELDRDSAGKIVRLNITFQQRCVGTQQFLQGAVQLGIH
ncbi:hypothetical protein ACFFYR_14795 [Paraburkholderia dipogonis]